MLTTGFFPAHVGAALLEVIEAPAAEAITLDVAKLHLRVDDGDEDELIGAMVVAARERLEGELNRPLLPQTCRVRLDDFPRERILLWNDVTDVVAVTYTDSTGAAQRMDATDFRLIRRAYLMPRNGWPKGEDVAVQFRCGAFTSADAVPESCCAWMKLVLGTLYEQRESVGAEQTYGMPGRFTDGLIDRYRVPTL
ncbi:head-tail connector protein [Burkholderia vietnamiensis]|uniref:head-tail connector protein n=1 Tax=Burkholderia vietnamiensis TaxID=60552 RepID=UPI0008413669|nr:phage head-tail connector protein [Burkholderia vietnamiensis]AOK40834.1 hypothetical protein WL96_07140 [Burkholderia vietnamiensis]